MKNIARFREFVKSLARLIDQTGNDEPRIVDCGSKLLADLVSHDDL